MTHPAPFRPAANAGPWAGAAWDETVLKAPRNWLRKASIGSSGAEGPGSSPSCQCQEAICLNTEGSWATIEITTSWLAPGRLIGLRGLLVADQDEHEVRVVELGDP